MSPWFDGGCRGGPPAAERHQGISICAGFGYDGGFCP
jgi:hypothetical protein